MPLPLPSPGQAHQSPPGCPARQDGWPEPAREGNGRKVGWGTKGCPRTFQMLAVCLGWGVHTGGAAATCRPPAPGPHPGWFQPQGHKYPAISWDSDHSDY